MTDFTSSFGMKRPQVSADLAAHLLQECFGVSGELSELGSNQDRNYLVTATDGIRRVLKVDNPAFAEEEIDAQLHGLHHLAASGLVVPQPVAGLDGTYVHPLSAPAGEYRARLLTFVEGEALAGAPRLGHRDARRLGGLAARIHHALSDFDHAGLSRRLQWDMRHSKAVFDQLIASVDDDGLRQRLRAACDDAWSRVATVCDELPISAVHGDLTPDNVVRTADDELAAIDFGDLAHGWRVAEIAVTAAGLLTRADGDASIALSAIEEYTSRVELTPAEGKALWPLVVMRGGVLVVSGIHQGALDADNAYVQERLAEELAVFETAQSVGFEVAAATIAAMAGHAVPRVPPGPFHALFGADRRVRMLDLAPESASMADGAWLGGAATRRRLTAQEQRPASIVALPYGRPDLTRSAPLSQTPPANVATAMALDIPGDLSRCPLHAPRPARVEEADGHRVVLAFDGTRLQIDGIRPQVTSGAEVAAGEILGVAIARDVRLMWARSEAPAPPAYVADPWARGWQRLTLDPAPLVGEAPLPSRPSAGAENARKSKVFAAAQEHYYEQPPLMVRGWGSMLIDQTGRPFLDMVNNVSSIGHSHPHLTAAVARQMSTLNTNSRFLYPHIAELSEKLLATAPDGFDTVLLVNSGTEAVDLALKIARLATGRRDVVAEREGYHGWSLAADAVSTSAFDNPHAVSTRPDWVHIAEAPNPYRGVHRGPDSGPSYVADLRGQLTALVAGGRPPAAYIAEPVQGNAGGVIPPAGYVAGAYAAVRAHGGLVISDEVQVGLGRLGRSFWGCVHQGATPDIIVTAKALGNVYPVGAVITRREIADALGRDGQFFSSAGGAPASCAAALAVLEVISEGELARNAEVVGDGLRHRLEELAQRHALIGTLHGTGLYQGVELVSDRERRTPAPGRAAAICERMREFGVIVQPASERQNVLKIKPSLALTQEEAEAFVGALDRTLEELG